MQTDSWQSRTQKLLGDEATGKLARASLFVAGAGGVGGYVVETLARSGVGRITVADADIVAESNINRQIIATQETVGLPKAILWERRIKEINPYCEVTAMQMFLTPENIPQALEGEYDYVADCIDTVAPKVALIRESLRRRIPLISSMGAGGRLDLSRIAVGDLWETREDGLARAVRQRFKALGEHPAVKVVWSAEAPRHTALIGLEGMENKRSSFGTLATVPAVFGLYMANHIILRITAAR